MEQVIVPTPKPLAKVVVEEPKPSEWWEPYLQRQKAGELYTKKEVGDDQNKYVAYASSISGNDLDFLATLNQENGLWTHDRKSNTGYYACLSWSNGECVSWSNSLYYDYGFCQMSEFYQADTYNAPLFYSSPQWQLDKCYEKYKTWVDAGVISSRLYGWNVRYNSKDKFHFISNT